MYLHVVKKIIQKTVLHAAFDTMKLVNVCLLYFLSGYIHSFSNFFRCFSLSIYFSASRHSTVKKLKLFVQVIDALRRREDALQRQWQMIMAEKNPAEQCELRKLPYRAVYLERMDKTQKKEEKDTTINSIRFNTCLTRLESAANASDGSIQMISEQFKRNSVFISTENT